MIASSSLAVVGLAAVLATLVPTAAARAVAVTTAALAAIGLGASLLLRRAARDIAAASAPGDARFRDAIENMSEGVLFFDAGGNVAAWNDRLLDMLPHLRPLLRPGIGSRELAVVAVEAAHPEWTAAEKARWVEGREASLRRNDYSAELPLADGRVVWVQHRRASAGGIVAVYRDITRERRAVDALAASEARFREAVDSMGEGLTLWDRDGRLLLWNARCIELLPHLAGLLRVGVGIDDINGAAVRIMHPDWPPERIDELVGRRLAARGAPGSPFNVELPDGRSIEIVDRRTSEGGLVTVYRDVTQARLAATTLAASEARFRDAVGSMGEGLILWDHGGGIVLWNERLLEILPYLRPHIRVGATLEEMNAVVVRDAHPEWTEAEIAARLEARLRAHADTGRPYILERTDGGIVEVVSQRTPGGGVVSIYRDVTEERRALESLRRGEERFRDGIQSMAEGFMMYDAADRLVTWNGTLLEMLPYLRRHLSVGRPRRDIVVEAVSEAFPNLAPAEHEAWVAERIASFRQYDRVFIMRPAGGRVIEVVERRTTEGGSVILYRDVTEREQQTSDLRRALTAEREASQQQRRFVAIASHEFRTPLTVIDGSAQRLIAMLEQAGPDVLKRLHRIRATVLRMTQLIDRTLSSARLDDGRLELKPERFDFAVLLRDASGRQRSISPEFELNLEAPASAEIVGDPRLLELVLTNLLSNAVKYSGASRTVEIGLTREDKAVVLTVCDHGVGIPAAEQGRLFQRYFRASTAAGIPGTGIGLHLVRELVGMHGGTIAVDSAVGRGTTFVVRLPKVASLAAIPARRERAAS
ncbi:MAG: PAS-domain containing protein [Alphaproteobacteria bacterium]|nr:PAS-domain containing protein [Alphaproteobacteria bacterium]